MSCLKLSGARNESLRVPYYYYYYNDSHGQTFLTLVSDASHLKVIHPGWSIIFKSQAKRWCFASCPRRPSLWWHSFLVESFSFTTLLCSWNVVVLVMMVVVEVFVVDSCENRVFPAFRGIGNSITPPKVVPILAIIIMNSLRGCLSFLVRQETYQNEALTIHISFPFSLWKDTKFRTTLVARSTNPIGVDQPFKLSTVVFSTAFNRAVSVLEGRQIKMRDFGRRRG